MDGMPGLHRGLATAYADGVAPIEKMVGPRAPPTPHKPGLLRLALPSGIGKHIRSSTALAAAMLAFLLGVLLGVLLNPALVGHIAMPALLDVGSRWS